MNLKIRNDKGDDFSKEVLLIGTLLFSQIEACSRICSILDRVLARQGWEIKLFHENKHNFNQTCKAMRNLEYHLNNLFEGAFDNIVKGDVVRHETMAELGMDFAQLNAIYLSKIDNNVDNRARIKKKILDGYKGIDIDIEAVLDLFTIK